MAESVDTFFGAGIGAPGASTMGGFSSYAEMGLLPTSSVGGGVSAAPAGTAGAAGASPMEKYATIFWAGVLLAAGLLLLHLT